MLFLKEHPSEIEIDEEEFSTQELDDAIEAFKKGKAHGTDELDNEMIILLGEINRQTLRTHINTAWDNKKGPEKWFTAFRKNLYVVNLDVTIQCYFFS